MEIINSTHYSTQDIADLYDAVYRTSCENHTRNVSKWRDRALAQGKAWVSSDYHKNKPKPDVMRIGYYNPKSDDRHCRMTKVGSNCPRLGIRKLDKMQLPAMLVVAAASSVGGVLLPENVVSDAVREMMRTMRGALSQEQVAKLATLHPIRTDFDRSDEKLASRRKVAQIADIRCTIADVDAEISKVTASLNDLQAKRLDLVTKLNNMEPKRMSLYV